MILFLFSIPDYSFASVVIIDEKYFDKKLVEFLIYSSKTHFFAQFIKEQMNLVN